MTHWIGIVSTIGMIGFFLHLNKKNTAVLARVVSHKMVQTETETETETRCNDAGVQCDVDLLEMRESGELAIVSDPSSNYRWFFIRGDPL